MPGVSRAYEINVQDHRLHYLSLSARHGSMRAAADYLNVAPSTISRQIKLLERALSIALVEPGSHKMVLTEAGTMLCDYYENRMAEHEELLTGLASLRNVRNQTIRIVAAEGLMAAPLLPAIAKISEKHPDASIELMSAEYNAAHRLILNDTAHFGLLLDSPEDARLRVHAASRQPFVALMPRDHPLASETAITPEMLAEHRLLTPLTSSRVFEIVQSVFSGRGLSLNIALKSSSMQIILKGVESGLGVAVLPSIFAAQGNKDEIVSRELVCDELRDISLLLVSRVGRKLEPGALDMRTALVRAIRKLPVL
ncbi:LysR family transcriptional regulator [Croceicoccus sediminis]|uniref:LysR family transcriptional regulator n=1 Tax=Croceicoccus sediminis TaxID=2571150 RepID=UPI0011839C1B|nr:LysR family transcriptional regulator [Croceicoccus sediminis]